MIHPLNVDQRFLQNMHPPLVADGRCRYNSAGVDQSDTGRIAGRNVRWITSCVKSARI
jgi:hypothetical protein